jgi:hypothetical protein
MVICSVIGCSTSSPGAEGHSAATRADAKDQDPDEFKKRVALLEHGMSIEEVTRIFGQPRMDTNLGEGQRIMSFARIYEGGRIRTVALSFQDGLLVDIPSAR